jgi:hypothetical protein
LNYSFSVAAIRLDPLFIGTTSDTLLTGSKAEFGFMFAFIRPNVSYDFDCVFSSSFPSQSFRFASVIMATSLELKNHSGLAIFTCPVPEIHVASPNGLHVQIVSVKFGITISVGTPLKFAHIPKPQFAVFPVLTGGRVHFFSGQRTSAQLAACMLFSCSSELIQQSFGTCWWSVFAAAFSSAYGNWILFLPVFGLSHTS